MTKHIRTNLFQVLAPRLGNAVLAPFRYRRRLYFAQAGSGVRAAKKVDNGVRFFIHDDHHKACLTTMQGKTYGSTYTFARMETWHDRLQTAAAACDPQGANNPLITMLIGGF